MKTINLWIVCGLLLAVPANAGIKGGHQLEIDLTNPEDARDKASWPPGSINITQGGLGWDGDKHSRREFWLMTKPLGIGVSWRPTTNANVRVTISPEVRSHKLPNGQDIHEQLGSVYVRFSPDRKHWSTWQPVGLSPESIADARQRAAAGESRVSYLRSFSTSVGVPQMSRRKYLALWNEHRGSDIVSRKDDQEAFVRRCVADDPDFFKDELPFIGYVQFLLETSLSGGLRLTQFKADVGWWVSGLRSIPLDPATETGVSEAWRFVAE